MSTSYSSPFNKFLSLITDRNLSVDLTDEQMTDLLNMFLDQSISLYFKISITDLFKRQQPDFYAEEFVADGITNEFIISKYPIDPNEDSISLVCQVDGVGVDYNFDVDTLTFTLEEKPTIGQEVACSYKFIGQFDDDLSEEEVWVIVYGMLVSWLQQKVFNASLFKNHLTTKDFNSFSAANLIDKLNELYSMAEDKLQRLIVSYSYNSGFRVDK